MFWGMTLYPGVEYTRDVTRQEYLTLASLDCRPQMNRGETNLTAYLVLKCDNYEHVLCTLVQGRAHQQILNFVLQEGEKMTLAVEGSGIVHITGYTLKHPVSSDDIDTRTETTSMREVSDGIQDGEVISPHPSSEGDDSTIIAITEWPHTCKQTATQMHAFNSGDEDITSEVKLENPNRFDLETVDSEEGSDQQFMDENTLPPDVVRDDTISTDTAPEGTTMDSNDTPCATPDSSVTNMTTSDHRWLNRENFITRNNLMQDTCNYALNIKEKTEQISYEHINCKNTVLRSNQTEEPFDSDVSTSATPESPPLNRGTNIHRQPNWEDPVSNNNIMENASNYTSYFEVKQEQASDRHLTSMHAVLTNNRTVVSDESSHETAELSAMNRDTNDCRGPNREDNVCTNDVMEKTTDYTSHFEVKREQALEQHLTSRNDIMTSNGMQDVIDSDESTNERTESSTINTDINDYKGLNSEVTVPADTLMKNITDYTSEFEEERELASEQHLTSTNGIMNSNGTEGAVDSEKSIHATPESLTTGLDTNDISWPNKKDTIPADSVMENITDYDTSDFEEEKEQASGQHLTSTNAIMNSNETEGDVNSDKSTTVTAESSTIDTDIFAYKGPIKEGTVPADSVMENITDYDTSDFEEEKEQASGQHLNSTNAIMNSNEIEGDVNSDKSTTVTAESSTIDTDILAYKGPIKEGTVPADSVMENITDYDTSDFEEEKEQASGQHLTSTNVIMNSNETEGALNSDKSTTVTAESSTIDTDILAYKGSIKEGTVPADSVMENITDHDTSDFEEEKEQASGQHLTSTNAIMNSNEIEGAVNSDKSTTVTAESSTIDTDILAYKGPIKEGTVPADSVMENITDYDTSDFEEEKEQASGQHLTSTNVIMNSNETEGNVNSDKSTTVTAESSTIDTDILAYKGSIKEGTVPADSVMENITDHDTSDFEEEKEQASGQHLTSTNAIMNSNEIEGAVNSDKSSTVTAESSTIDTDILAYKGPIKEGTVPADSVMENITDCTSDFEEDRGQASGQVLATTNVIIASNEAEGAIDANDCTSATTESSASKMNTNHHSQSPDGKGEGKSMQQIINAETVLEGSNDSITQGTVAYQKKEFLQTSCKLVGKNVNNAVNAVNSEFLQNGAALLDSGPCQALWKTKRCYVLLERIDKFFSNYADSHSDGTSFLLQFNGEKVIVKNDLSGNDSNRIVKPAITSQSSVRMCCGRTLFKCQVCLKTFSTMESLTRHSNIHISEKFLKSYQSGEKFIHKAKLKTRGRILTGQNNYKRSPCLKKFNHRTHILLKKMHTCKHCNKKFKTKGDLYEHEGIHTGEKPHKCKYCDAEKTLTCKYCNEKFSHNEDLRAHKIIHNGEKHFACKCCDKKFGRELDLKRHTRIHIGEKPHTCKYCNKKFRWKKTLQIHESNHTGKIQCEYCNKEFSHKPDLWEHRKIHEGEKPFTCKCCDKKFHTKSHLKRHATIHTGEKPFKCNYCSKTFRQSGTRKIHERIHTHKKSFTCDYCDRKFSRKKDLNEHEKNHTGEMPYTCKHCGRMYSSKVSLRYHEIIHTGKKTFTCEHCDMKFYRKGDLIRHKMTHTGEKPFACKFCNKKFSQSGYLKRHERIHTDEKPYSCEHCDKKFRWRKTLLIHERTHTDVNRSRGEHFDNENINSDGKAFTCGYCYQRFSLLEHLTEHERVLCTKKPFTCEYCNKKFIHKGSLTLHKTTHTDVEASTSENCNEKFSQKDHLQLHEGVHNVGKHFTCKHCDESFSQKDHFHLHERSHACEKLFTCEHCNEKFTKKDYLQEHEKVHNIEKPFACKHCNEKFSQKEHLQLHEKSHTGEKLFTCEHCNEKFTQKDYLQEHEKVHNIEKPFACKHCNEKFSQKEHLQLHEKSHTGEKLFTCEHCNEKFTQKDYLQEHEKVHNIEKPFACKHCNEKFSQKEHLKIHEKVHTGEELKLHERAPHTGEKPYICSHCNKGFSQKSALDSHERIHTGERPFSCSHCNRGFRQKVALKLHERTHTGEKPYICSHCNRGFSQKSALNSHVRIHTGETPFECIHCNKRFKQKAALVSHERNLTEGKTFTCQYCKKTFSLKSCLKVHEKNHVDESFHTEGDPCRCKQCGKKFSQKYYLTKHARIHTGEKPFTCQQCGKKFSQKYYLKKHARIHTGEKPFTCKHCNWKFSRKISLTLHERLHTGERVHACGHCSKVFVYKSLLKRHEIIHTGKYPFTCKLCNKKFSLKTNLTRHHQSIHNGEPSFSCEGSS